jgi:phosphate transport system protein
MRKRFDEQLHELKSLMISMGRLIENAISIAVKALITRDTGLADKAIQCDYAIDEMEKEIESLCLTLFLQQQPVARDLRMISAVLKMITDMERIGDHAADISEIVKVMAGREYIKHMEHIPQMAKVASGMVTNSIEAFVNRDLELARAVIKADEEVDALFTAVRRGIIELIRADAEEGEQGIDMMMIAKYFERIGDHAENIAEWAEFSITGVHKRVKVL